MKVLHNRAHLHGEPKYGNNKEWLTIDQIKAEHVIEINQQQKAFKNMHQDGDEWASKKRAKKIAADNKRTNIVQLHFTPGDFVLVRFAQNKRHKL